MPRFVLLLHECPGEYPRPTHCDLMFELGDELRTWSLLQLPRDWARLKDCAEFPQFAPTNTVETEQLADHRLAYLDYEGPVSGDRGTVRRLDEGMFTSLPEANMFTVAGKILRGEIAMQKMSADDALWTLEYRPAENVTD